MTAEQAENVRRIVAMASGHLEQWRKEATAKGDIAEAIRLADRQAYMENTFAPKEPTAPTFP